MLLHVVLLHPALLTMAELIAEFAADPKDPRERGEVEASARALARDGLLRLRGSIAMPTRAAIRAYELWQA